MPRKQSSGKEQVLSSSNEMRALKYPLDLATQKPLETLLRVKSAKQ